MMEERSAYKRTSEPLNDVSEFIRNSEYAGRVTDERHARIAKRHLKNCDATLNGMMGTAEFQREVLRKIPFREAEPTHA